MAQDQPPMNLFQLWWTAMVHPARAFEEVGRKPSPMWACWVLVIFNLLISLTTNLARFLSSGELLLPSWLTFLPDDRYLFAQLFFIPVLRMLLWVMSSGIVHVILRLSGRKSDFDLILQIGGVIYLVVMPYTLAVDWASLALGVFGFGLIVFIHGTVDLVWSFALTVIGLHVLLRLEWRTAMLLNLLSTLVSLPLLAVFAR